jgi:hypothetical protein
MAKTRLIYAPKRVGNVLMIAMMQFQINSTVAMSAQVDAGFPFSTPSSIIRYTSAYMQTVVIYYIYDVLCLN